jgi:hypothetical protein
MRYDQTFHENGFQPRTASGSLASSTHNMSMLDGIKSEKHHATLPEEQQKRTAWSKNRVL